MSVQSFLTNRYVDGSLSGVVVELLNELMTGKATIEVIPTSRDDRYLGNIANGFKIKIERKP